MSWPSHMPPTWHGGGAALSQSLPIRAARSGMDTVKLAVMSAQIVDEAGSWQCGQKAKESMSGYY